MVALRENSAVGGEEEEQEVEEVVVLKEDSARGREGMEEKEEGEK